MALPWQCHGNAMAKPWYFHGNAIWAHLAEFRPAKNRGSGLSGPSQRNPDPHRGSHDLVEFRPTQKKSGSEIVALGGVEERAGQILARQVLARPPIIIAGREYSGPAKI